MGTVQSLHVSTKLNTKVLACWSDARRMMNVSGPTVSVFYGISDQDWLLADQEQFSSATTLRRMDFDRLLQGNINVPQNTRSSMRLSRKAREITPPLQKSKSMVEHKPNNKHHKMYRQVFKPPGQAPGEFSRDYPREILVEGDDRRYKGLETPKGDSLFVSFDLLDIMNTKHLIMASSDHVYTPCIMFWPAVIFLTTPKLDWGQSVGLALNVQRVVSMVPQVIVKAGSNHLQSQGLLSRLMNG